MQLLMLFLLPAFAGWNVETKIDPMTDQALVVASVPSNDGQALMVVRCAKSQFSMFVVVRGVIHDQDNADILVRIDKGEPTVYQTSSGVDSDTLFVWKGELLSALVARAQSTLLVRVPRVWALADNAAIDRDYAFSVEGAAKVIDQVRRPCGLNPIYESLVQPIPQVREPPPQP